MLVVVEQEILLCILFQDLAIVRCFKFKDGAFIRYGMDMRNSAIVPRFRKQHATAIRIQRLSKHIEKEISLAHKADAKRVAVLWRRRTAIPTATPEVFYPVIVGFK